MNSRAGVGKVMLQALLFRSFPCSLLLPWVPPLGALTAVEEIMHETRAKVWRYLYPALDRRGAVVHVLAMCA